MNNKVKQRLLELLSTGNAHTVAILGDELYYAIDEEMKTDTAFSWGEYFKDIATDKSFKTDIDNMHLIVTRSSIKEI